MRLAIETNPTLQLRRLRNPAIFDTMCDLLARRSEIFGMRRRDIDLAAGTIRITHSKTDQTGRGVVFQISPRTISSLDAWLTASKISDIRAKYPDALPVFAGILNDGNIRLGPRKLQELMDRQSIARILQRYAESLVITGVAANSLRRSTARAIYEAGVPEDEIVKKRAAGPLLIRCGYMWGSLLLFSVPPILFS